MAVGENEAMLFIDVRSRGLVRGREVDVDCIRVVEIDLAHAQADSVDGLDPLQGLFLWDLLDGSHCANTRPLAGRKDIVRAVTVRMENRNPKENAIYGKKESF